MTSFGKPGKWQRAMMVATGIGVLGASLVAPLAEAAVTMPTAQHTAFRLQDESQPSQVGEGNADTETLDQGSPPAASGDDVETLDQGSPPSGVPVPVADGTVLTAPVAPVASETAYTAPAGPQLPPGFGEGRVMVSNNPRGYPVGLEPCAVGVVSGRAYVGVKCGDKSDPVVGHSTYDNFPWVIDPGFPFEPGADVVTDPSFPFDEDSPFFESTLDRTTDSDVVVLVAPRGFPFNDDEDDTSSNSTEAPSVSTGGVVSLAQPARTAKERNRERNASASSGDVASDPGKSRTRRSTSKKQKANASSESKRGKKSGNKAKANKNKKKDRKNANKASKKQRAKSEKREKRNKNSNK